ncbi:MAG: hypothetical protein ACSLFI_00590 [Solirubrobacterales bacterium]
MRGTLLCTTAVLAAGVLLSACGSESHENGQRPPLPTVVSVSISEGEILVSPRAIGVPRESPVNISQNKDSPENQAAPELPLIAQVAISNLVPEPTRLFLEGPAEAVEPLTASGSGGFNQALPPGIYRFSSPASTGTARLLVGPSRVSASGDLLTP